MTANLNLDACWGPFSPVYLGLTRILCPSRGATADLALSIERLAPRTVVLPNNTFDYSQNVVTGDRRTVIRAVPESVAADYSTFSIRYLLDPCGDWALARFAVLSRSRVHCTLRFHNSSDQLRRYRCGLGLLASDPRKPIRLKTALQPWWLPANQYHSLTAYQQAFGMGCRACVSRAFNWGLEETVLAQAFGGWSGDRVTYRFQLPEALRNGQLYFRYVKYGDYNHPWEISINGRPTRFRFPRTWAIPGGGYGKNRDAWAEWRLLRVPLGAVPAGDVDVALQPINPPNNDLGRIWLDGMLFSEGLLPGDEGSAETLPTRLTDVRRKAAARLTLTAANAQSARFRICMPDLPDHWVTIAAETIRLHARTGSGSLLADLRTRAGQTAPTMERDAETTTWGALDTDAIAVPPGAERCVALTFSIATAASEAFDNAARTPRDAQPRPCGQPVQAGRPYASMIERLRDTLLFNINYPFPFEGRYTHYLVPSKFFPLPYSWDGGFAAVGLSTFAPAMAWRQTGFFMAADTDAFPFFYCGSPVPTPLYALWDTLQNTRDAGALERLYNGAARMHDFYLGRTPGSQVNAHHDGLLSTYAYNYNLGIDDHPIQRWAEHNHLTRQGLYSIILMSQVLRCARIMRNLARRLGRESDVERFRKDVELLSGIIDRNMWDPESGLYGWLYRKPSGAVAPVVLDGCAGDRSACAFLPLFAGITSRKAPLIDALFDPDRFRTPHGISSVDRQAPSYNPDGYWNGSVWPVMQWYLWRGLLEAGAPGPAREIAETILATWQQAWDREHYLGEHFRLKLERMSGAPNFGGLSAALLPMHAAYFKPYHVTPQFEVMLLDVRADPVRDRLDLRFCAPFLETPDHDLLLNMGRGGARYAVTHNNRPQGIHTADAQGHLSLKLPRPTGEDRLSLRLAEDKART